MKKLILALSICVFMACEPGTATYHDTNPVSEGMTLKHLQWLCGTWKFVNNDGSLSFEIWKKESDTLLRGHGFLISGSDTIFSEKLALVQRKEDLFYIPLVNGENNNTPVEFKFFEFNKGEYIFVNAAHDFPQRIIYKNPQPDFLCARIEGTQNGKFRKEDFQFLKVGK